MSSTGITTTLRVIRRSGGIGTSTCATSSDEPGCQGIIVWEYFYKEFNARGGNDYLQTWAAEVDLLAERGWAVLDCVRRPRRPGFWTTVLCRPASEFEDELLSGKSRTKGGEDLLL
jgi:hypothetical protein